MAGITEEVLDEAEAWLRDHDHAMTGIMHNGPGGEEARSMAALVLELNVPARGQRAEGRAVRFSLTCHAYEDWAVPDHETGAVFVDEATAAAEAERWMRAAIAAGTPERFVGVYVISDDADVEAGGDPSVEALYTLNGGTLWDADAGEPVW